MPEPHDPRDRPQYRKYRARRGLLGRRPQDGESALDELRRDRDSAPAPPGPRDAEAGRGRDQWAGAGSGPPPAGGDDRYAVHRRRGLPLPFRRRRRALGPFTVWRFVRWVVLAVAGWLALSLVLFLVSAQLQQSKVDGATGNVLESAGPMPFAANTILVLGSDARTRGTHEPGASIGGPSRSDSIMLMRIGGGHNSRLSIARDTVVDIPGHGLSKINAAYAYGGAPLAIDTIRRYLGIPINHIVQVSFDNFPSLIDAMGGIGYQGGCVVSRINGGSRNGGYTLRLRAGKSHIDGKQALALARTRKNECNHRETDLTRAHRQQKIFAAMKSRLLSPAAFPRLPMISWDAPKAIDSDMAGPSLLGLFGALAAGGTPTTQVLGTLSGQVSVAQKQAAVRRFLDG